VLISLASNRRSVVFFLMYFYIKNSGEIMVFRACSMNYNKYRAIISYRAKCTNDPRWRSSACRYGGRRRYIAAEGKIFITPAARPRASSAYHSAMTATAHAGQCCAAGILQMRTSVQYRLGGNLVLTSVYFEYDRKAISHIGQNPNVSRASK